MEPSVTRAIIKMVTKAFLLTAIIGVAIGIIGYTNQWDTSTAYSNAFFVAGCLVIIAGTASRLGAGQEWNSFQLIHAESFRDMSNVERTNFIVNASSALSPLILGLLSGILLIIISAIAAYLF